MANTFLLNYDYVKSNIDKVVLSSAASFFLFGPKVALITAIFNLIMMGARQCCDITWFSKKRIVNNLKDGFRYFLALVIFWNFLLAPNLQRFFSNLLDLKDVGSFPQATYIFSNTVELFFFFLRQILVFPLAKEIFFRGMVQDEIEMAWRVVSPGSEKKLTSKYVRIALGALFYSLCFFKPHFFFANIYNFTYGVFSASLREDANGLVASAILGIVHGFFDSATMFWNILGEI